MTTDPVEPAPADAAPAVVEANSEAAKGRSLSFSQQSRTSEDSQTAADFIRNQELLEADAREALPYSIESCTKILGPLRQAVFACLTCNPAPVKPEDKWTPAGVCYACSVQCHGEHELVEIFQKRNFTCDCGTTRLPSTSPCALRINEKTKTKGNVHSEQPNDNNKYSQNFRNRFCGCECDYDPFQQKGTMFQCLGLGTIETGGCGEDWYHPGCLVGIGADWFDKNKDIRPAVALVSKKADSNGLETIAEDNEDQKEEPKAVVEEEAVANDEEEDPPLPPGFPEEDDFEGFLCYKCVEANPWVKQYAGTSGFLPAVFLEQPATVPTVPIVSTEAASADEQQVIVNLKKRKVEDEEDVPTETKRAKSESVASFPDEQPEHDAPLASAKVETVEAKTELGCKLKNFAPAPSAKFSLFFKEDFRDHFCRCSDCYPRLDVNPQLLEEEEVYEPPMSDDGAASQHGGSTHGSGSLLERGESALRNVDRVRAIEGVMAYNHLKEKLKPFFQQFAESGQAVGAEDIKAYFAKLRGDEQGIKEAGAAAASSKDEEGGDGDGRKEQSGY